MDLACKQECHVPRIPFCAQDLRFDEQSYSPASIRSRAKAVRTFPTQLKTVCGSSFEDPDQRFLEPSVAVLQTEVGPALYKILIAIRVRLGYFF